MLSVLTFMLLASVSDAVGFLAPAHGHLLIRNRQETLGLCDKGHVLCSFELPIMLFNSISCAVESLAPTYRPHWSGADRKHWGHVTRVMFCVLFVLPFMLFTNISNAVGSLAPGFLILHIVSRAQVRSMKLGVRDPKV